ncbi:MAG: hypothetical protein CL610_06050 [Anaerolineaceae bacterium]|nr:hypothetical protein [Anaerolineaceae bacterium]
MASKFTCFDGQVTFHCTYQSLESLIVREAIDLALPDLAEVRKASVALSADQPSDQSKEQPEPSQRETIFANFRSFVGDTPRIDFKLRKDADPDLIDFRDWWQFAENNSDYAAVWKRFLQQVNLNIHDQWNDAIGNAIPARLLAPRDVQPDAPDDEALDPNASAPAPTT